MTMSDNLGDTLIRIKNASRAGRMSCSTYFSNEKEGVLKVLVENGIIASYEKRENEEKHVMLFIALNDKTASYEFKRVSKPGRRMYARSTELRPIKGGRGLLLVSTSHGIMSGVSAKEKNIGGELLAEIY